MAVLEPEILNYASIGDDFASDISPRALANGKKLYGYVSKARWLHIGLIERLKASFMEYPEKTSAN